MKKLPLTFKPVSESQRELIHRWLRQDYIGKWIHGAGLKNTLDSLEQFFQYRAAGKGLDRQTEIMQHWVGYDGDKPFVYLITSNVFKNERSEYTQYSQTNGFIITLDIFFGEPDHLGKGLAVPVIKEFLMSQFADVAEVFIDPEASNHKAIHVYQKAGFHIVGEFIAPWHPVPHLIMKLDMKDLSSAH